MMLDRDEKSDQKLVVLVLSFLVLQCAGRFSPNEITLHAVFGKRSSIGGRVAAAGRGWCSGIGCAGAQVGGVDARECADRDGWTERQTERQLHCCSVAESLSHRVTHFREAQCPFSPRSSSSSMQRWAEAVSSFHSARKSSSTFQQRPLRSAPTVPSLPAVAASTATSLLPPPHLPVSAPANTGHFPSSSSFIFLPYPSHSLPFPSRVQRHCRQALLSR